MESALTAAGAADDAYPDHLLRNPNGAATTQGVGDHEYSAGPA
jgi:hypothetical protein